VDAIAMGATMQRHYQHTPGDPFLSVVAPFDEYQSLGQRAAVRSALTVPPGATLLVCLPTGEGKSLVFYVVARLGFGDAVPPPGVTLVVTPTVALALDHERSAGRFGFDDAPRAYVGSSDRVTQNQNIVDAIRQGTQGLCFASPEAVCTTLRAPLLEAAAKGALRAIVIDEAHIVDTWGTSFRPEFQLLSGIRRDLLRKSPPALQARTLLLSATVTLEAASTLKTLFATDDNGNVADFAVCSALTLRPEIDYWVAAKSDAYKRRHRVEDALLHLPRPAILYATEVRHAQDWMTHLRQLGFGRISTVTGETPNEERLVVINKWSRGEIDLVVATSAFGLGIDYPNVRTVIHACVPEGIDRFYQEVGRGGRDGRSAISLVIPTERDAGIARSLGRQQQLLISAERGFQRWSAMFNHPDRRYLGDGESELRIDIPPSSASGDIDMDSEQNTDWNSRTLTLMASAGMLTLQATSIDSAATNDSSLIERIRRFQTVRILDPEHLNPTHWEAVVEPHRIAVEAATRRNFDFMVKHLSADTCPAQLLAPLYEVDVADVAHISVARACGGCSIHRINLSPYHELPTEPLVPWPAASQIQNPVAETMGPANCLVVFSSDVIGVGNRSAKRRARETFAQLIRCGFRNLLVLAACDLNLAELQRDVIDWPFFVGSDLISHNLPPGPVLLICSRDTPLQRSWFRVTNPADARLLFLPTDFPDPDRLGVPLRQSLQQRQLTFAEFQMRLAS